jgi:hypothetical protein
VEYPARFDFFIVAIVIFVPSKSNLPQFKGSINLIHICGFILAASI